jgi:hypothetical protein
MKTLFKVKEFIKALLIFIQLYKDGFFFSDNTHKTDVGERWGFYRFNHKDQSGLFDIDFSIYPDGHGFQHIHGDDYRFTMIRYTPKYLTTQIMKKGDPQNGYHKIK